MGRVAFVFSGQGDQYPGMGQELLTYPAAKQVYGLCDAIRPGTVEQMFHGTEEELKETKNTQPCLFAMELALAKVLEEKGFHADCVAGFSMGEVAALTFGGAMSLEEGFRLVCKRGELMQSAAAKHDTAMAAVVKLNAQQVRELCANFEELYPVNYNGPGQITVAGRSEVMPEFFTAVKAAGGKAIPLKVKGAFHSPFMAEAAEAFGELLKDSALCQPKAQVYSNVSAEPYGAEVTELLAKQISSPVRWEEIVQNMIAEGVDTFVEIGPGKTLCNLIKRMDGSVKLCSALELIQEDDSHAQ